MPATLPRRTRFQLDGRTVSAWFLCALLANLASCGGEPTLVVPPTPVPPTQVGSIPAQIVNVGESAVIDVAPYFIDPDGGPLSYAAATSSPAVVSVSMSGSILTMVGVADGTATVVVTATDQDGLSATQNVSVTVQTPNRAPAPSGSIPALSIDVGRTATLDLASYFSDPDGDALGYAATTSNVAVVSASVSGSALTLRGVADGTATVTVTATDPGGLSATQRAGVTVETPNHAPAPSGSIPARNVNVGRTETLDVAPYFSDPDGDVLTYGAATAAPAVVSVSMSGSILTMVGVAADTATVTVTATDPGGLSATQPVRVTVDPPNRAPVPSGSIPARSIDAGRTETLDVASYFSDPDGDALNYIVSTSNAGVVSVGVSGSTLRLTGVAAGTATVTVTAADPDGLTATQRVRVTVPPPNRAPTPSGSIPAQRVDVGQTETLDVASYFSDPDGDALGYAAATSNAGVVSVGVSGSTLRLTGVAADTATVTVTAADPDGLSATQSVRVTVEPRNRAPAPYGSIPAQRLSAGRAETLDVASYFSDPDGDTLVYAATTSNAGIVSVGVSGSALTLTGVAAGTATVTVTATDPDGRSARQRVSVTVGRRNHAPAPTGSIPAQNLDGGRAVTLDVARYFSDPDRDALTYAATTSNAGVVSPRLFRSSLTLIARAGGEATVTVTATDPGGLSGTQTIEVSVRGRAGGFRDDFETSASLQDWSTQGAEATVTDSVLHLTNSATGTGTAERSSPPRLRGWELSAEISRITDEATPGVIWFTGHDRFHALRLLLPTSTTMNYEFAAFDGTQNAWIVIEDLSGRSRRIGATPNSYDQFRLGHETDGYFVFEVGEGDFSSAILRLSLDAPLHGVRLGDLLDRIVDVWLVNRGAAEATALFDWVEVSGEEVAPTAGDADAPPGFDRVKAAAGAPAVR